MSEPIKVGDLVVVVRPTHCCGGTTAIGKLFRVTAIVRSPRHRCTCGVMYDAMVAQDGALLNHLPYGAPLPRLKRIDPLTEPESTEHREVIEI